MCGHDVCIALKKTSFVDFPGCLSAVFFFAGCNLRCPWCQNRELVIGEKNENLVCIDKGIAHLVKRRSVIKGAVLSGGEPTISQYLPDIINEIKALGFLVKLDTNGMNPQMLERLFEKEETKPDYIALDLKLSPDLYRELAPQDEKKDDSYGERLIQSAEIIKTSGIAHEYRSLALPDAVFTGADIEALAPLADNDSPWYFRPFVPGSCLDASWNEYKEPLPGMVHNMAMIAVSLGKNATGALAMRPDQKDYPYKET